ncbi:MAG: hypothetical protein NC342_07610 [Pseudoflavonifractor sp.]|nr:hypothetical protein [Pseudoflavonifractor sp.]
MHIVATDSQGYEAAITRAPHIFNTASFNRLNAHKAESVEWLLALDETRGNAVAAGIILGLRAATLLSPFSAPFGGLSPAAPLGVDSCEAVFTALASHARSRGLSLRVTLPPPFYAPTSLAHQANILSRLGSPDWADLNYHYPLRDFAAFRDHLPDTARKHLNRALKAPLRFVQLSSSPADIARAYAVIEANRREHGYPLRMTLNDVIATTKIIPADFFVVEQTEPEPRDVAAAQVFHVSESIVQVIYWGHISDANPLYPMSFLAYRLFRHYFALGSSIVDLGPSSEHGIPAPGLCRFKESLGCIPTLKPTFTLPS